MGNNRMSKIKKANQIHDKEKGAKIIEDKLSLTRDNINESKLDQWIHEIEEGEIENWTLKDIEKWKDFKDRYSDEFEDKIELLDRIMDKKKEKVKVTWISVFKEK
jgi:uncharacterized protein YeaO (DUF488 family)